MNTSNKYWLLYKKELKALSAPFFILTATYVFFILYFLFSDEPFNVMENAYNYRDGLLIFIFISLFIFPGILLYSYYDERANNTAHQMLTFPVPRYTVMLYKFMALLSISVVAVILLSIYYHLFELKMLANTNIYYETGIPPVTFALRLFVTSFFMLSLASATVGILSTVKRYHVFIGIVVFGILYALYRIMMLFLIHLIFGPGVSDMNGSYLENMSLLLYYVFPLLFGSVYLLFGLYVFHRYNDV